MLPLGNNQTKVRIGLQNYLSGIFKNVNVTKGSRKLFLKDFILLVLSHPGTPEVNHLVCSCIYHLCLLPEHCHPPKRKPHAPEQHSPFLQCVLVCLASSKQHAFKIRLSCVSISSCLLSSTEKYLQQHIPRQFRICLCCIG